MFKHVQPLQNLLDQSMLNEVLIFFAEDVAKSSKNWSFTNKNYISLFPRTVFINALVVVSKKVKSFYANSCMSTSLKNIYHCENKDE